MIYSFPDYYDDFRCIANQCEATCCAGWQIVIDEESLQRYKRVSKHFQERMKKGVNFKEGVFFQKEQKRCAFLNINNLCDMYTALGEDALCETCKRYPRHIEEFENVREFTLSISCPEVARILLSKKEQVTFYDKEIQEADEEFDDFNPMLYAQLVEARKELISILQDRTLEVGIRAALCWRFVMEFQDTMDEGILLTKESMSSHIKDKQWRSDIILEWQEWHKEEFNSYQNIKTLFGLLWKLEFLSEDWEERLLEVEHILYENGQVAYTNLQKEFLAWQKQEFPEWEIIAEQLLVYFVSTYFCGAVYDEYVASKMKLAIVSTFYIREFMMAQWRKNGGVYSKNELLKVVYRYSRELEHSDENLCLMDKLLEELNIAV